MIRNIFLSILFLPFALQAQTSKKQIIEHIEKTRKEWNVPGVAVGIVKNDSIYFLEGFGVENLKTNSPVTATSQFGIASNTKAFTAAAIGILVDEGKLNWEDKVVKHLPWFKMYNDYVTQEFTIKDLLSHRSGLKTFSGDLIWYGSTYSRQQIIEHAQFLTPAYDFRDKFGYSNIMYLAAGEIVTKVSGMNYDDFIRTRIFEPLGMNNTNSSIKKNPAKGVAMPHAQVDGKNVEIPYVNWDNIAAAGSINSNITDMAKWIKMLLNEGKTGDKKIISNKSLVRMYTPVTNAGVGGLSLKLHPTKHFSLYGMGFNTFDYHGVQVVNHSGGLDGMISHLAFIPEKKCGLVILTNAGTGLPGILMYDILDHLLGKPNENYAAKYLDLIKQGEAAGKAEDQKKSDERKKDTKPTLKLSEYVGKYSGYVYGSVTVELLKNGKLKIQLDQTPTMYATLDHWENDVFSFKFPEHPSLPMGWVTFKLSDDKTKVYDMIIDLPNPDFDFTELDLHKEVKK